ncbi:MAG: Ig-like domain-containing protein, partial [Bacteroidales bacterium]|nr:Ig-like domain-containing protein [Bacteroidales bacterium]
MKIKGKIPVLIVAALAWIVIISSCANPGMPVGGPQDSIPPVLIKTEPVYKSLNFKGKDVKLTFNEYIATENISEALVISPPMVKKPIIRTKSKTLVIEFNEELKDSATYSLDFKNSIADNNEKNELENFRFSFSTGDVFDSLRVAGRLMNAFNQEPIDKGLVLIHKNLHDSAVYRVTPDYIAKTDEEGLFMIDNIAPGKYHLFSIVDINNNLMYDEGAEEMAFEDTLIIPSAEFVEEVDTIFTATDTIVVMGHTHFFPEPVYLQQFTENIFDQFLDSYTRDTRYKSTFVFNESVKDSFELNLIENNASNWYQMEYNENVDSLIVWIADTTVARMDTLLMEVSYLQLDSMNQLYLQKDTVEMNFADKEDERSKKKKKSDDEEETPEPVIQFNLQTDISSSVVELNKNIGINFPEPIFAYDSTKIILYLSDDTLKKPLNFKFEKDTLEYRKYNIIHQWESEEEYTLQIDSAAFTNIYGITSRKSTTKFSARVEDYYGTV